MRDMIEYLPPYMAEYVEMQRICDAEHPEFDVLWDESNRTFLESFVDSLDDYGCMRWEKILKITPFASDTLNDRRFRIKTLINSQLPYTYTHVYDVLVNLCGEGKFTMNLDHNEYILSVLVELTAKRQLDVVVEKLKVILPANLLLVIDLRYNQHSLFIGNYTHDELTVFLHREMKEDSFV